MNSMTIDQQFQVVTLTSKQWQVLSEALVSKDPRVSSDALFTPIPLSERGPEPEELDEFGRCWWGEGAPLDEPGAMCFWSLSTPEAADGSDTHFAPWWALPIPPPG
jgi:hypothetical protein